MKETTHLPAVEHPALHQRVQTSCATVRVTRAGRRIIVTTAEVVHIDANGKVSDGAVMQQTLVPVARTY